MRIGWDIVAGAPLGSTDRSTTCAVMIVSTPVRIADRNGGRSIASSCARVCVTSGSPKWLSTAVSPCPGKCLATAATPPRW